MPDPIVVLDLPYDAVEAVEEAVGLPLDQWEACTSKAKLYAAIWEAADGTPPPKGTSITELIARVSITPEPEGKPSAGAVSQASHGGPAGP